MGPVQTFEDWLGLLRRRAVLLMLVTATGMILSVLFALSRPHVYEASAVIQIETPRVDAAVVAGTAPNDAAVSRQVQLIEQRLMARENIQRVIAKLDLFLNDTDLSDTRKVFLLRDATRIEPVSAPAPGYGSDSMLSAIVITARLGDREKAAQVANEFAQNVLDQNAQYQQDRRREALAFFETEEARLSKELAAIDSEISDYKTRNLDALPGSQVSLRRELEALRTEERALDKQLVALDSDRRASQGTGVLRDVTRRRVQDIEEQIGVLNEQRQVLSDRIAVVQGLIDRAPEVERTVTALERRQQQLQERYNVVTRGRAEAETSQRLAASRDGESFQLLERAIPPEFPEKSNRRKLAAAGSLASAVFALGVALVLDMLNPVLRTPGQVQRQTGLVPVISIPPMMTPAEMLRRRRIVRVVSIALLTVGFLLTMGMIGAYALVMV